MNAKIAVINLRKWASKCVVLNIWWHEEMNMSPWQAICLGNNLREHNFTFKSRELMLLIASTMIIYRAFKYFWIITYSIKFVFDFLFIVIKVKCRNTAKFCWLSASPVLYFTEIEHGTIKWCPKYCIQCLPSQLIEYKK